MKQPQTRWIIIIILAIISFGMGHAIKQLDDSLDLSKNTITPSQVKIYHIGIVVGITLLLLIPSHYYIRITYWIFFIFLLLWSFMDKNMYDKPFWKYLLYYTGFLVLLVTPVIVNIFQSLSSQQCKLLCFFQLFFFLFALSGFYGEHKLFSEEVSTRKLKFRKLLLYLLGIGLLLQPIIYYIVPRPQLFAVFLIYIFAFGYLLTSVRNLSNYLINNQYKLLLE